MTDTDMHEHEILKALCEGLDEGHDRLLEVMIELRRGGHRALVYPVFADNVAHYVTDSPNETLALIANREISLSERRSLKGQLKEIGDLTGIQISTADGSRGGFFLPDASEPGRVRLTMFDARGFYSHITRDTYQELADLVIEYGFTKQDDEILHRLSSEENFKKGNAITSGIARVNEGRMSYDKFAKYVRDIEEGVSHEQLMSL